MGLPTPARYMRARLSGTASELPRQATIWSTLQKRRDDIGKVGRETPVA